MDVDRQRVLVVHHEQEMREKIIGELEKKGYRVCVASDGLNGMFYGYYEKFTIILCALDLPKISGIEMIRTLRILSFNRKTPVIFIESEQDKPEAVALAAKLNAIVMSYQAITSSINNTPNVAKVFKKR